MRFPKQALLLVLAFVTFFAPNVNAQGMQKANVVDLASGNPDLSTFVAAVKAANLAGTLSDSGPYTVFAPTNAAFDKLPAGLVEALLKPRNQTILADILTFHVMDSKVDAAGVLAGIKADRGGRLIATTLNGNLTVTNKGGNVMVKGEQGRTGMVTGTDMMSGNGIIHTVDNVFLPENIDVSKLLKNTALSARQRMQTDGSAMSGSGGAMSDKSVVTLASENSDFSTLVTAVKKAGLVKTLNGSGPFTIFAPTNAAFGNVPSELTNALMMDENRDRLGNVLKYHVVPGRITSADLMKMFDGNGDDFDLRPLFGDEFEVEKHDGGIRISDGSGNKVNFVKTDIAGSNGIIHVIDRVMMSSNDTEVEDILEGLGRTASTAGSGFDAGSRIRTDINRGNNGSSLNRTANNTVVTVASGNSDFSTLVTAVQKAGLVDMLNSADGITVFAPTNAAFDKVPSSTLNSLLETRNQQDLQNVLSFHVLPGRVSAGQLLSAIQSTPRGQYLQLQTVGGKSLYAYTRGGNVYLVDGKGNRVQVVQTDVNTGNGVIHAVESVLMPYKVN